MRRVGTVVALVVVVVALVAGGAAVSARIEKQPRVRGLDFSLKLSTDESFCLQANADTGAVIVGGCAALDAQHFTFTDSADGTNTLVGDGGKCLDRGNGRPGRLLTVRQCTFGPTQQFVFRRTGELSDPAGTVCVAVSQAAQDARVLDDHCHITSGLPIETFVLSR